MAKLHVLLEKEALDRERLAGKVVVVLDVLFATSTIVTALAHGASSGAHGPSPWIRPRSTARAACAPRARTRRSRAPKRSSRVCPSTNRR